MAIEVILSQESPGWNLDWGRPRIIRKIPSVILDYQRWRCWILGLDLKCLILFKRVYLVWNVNHFLRSTTLLYVKKGSDPRALAKVIRGAPHIKSTTQVPGGKDSSDAGKSSTTE